MSRFLLSALLFSNISYGAYRAYVITVTYYDAKGKAGRTEQVTTTLDPDQYLLFHGLIDKARAKLEKTWYCPGDTSHKEFCEPMKQAPARGVASDVLGDPGKKTRLPLDRQPIIP